MTKVLIIGKKITYISVYIEINIHKNCKQSSDTLQTVMQTITNISINK